VTTLVTESDKEIKEAMLKLIMSMTNASYMTLEGGQTLIKFLVDQCIYSPPKGADKKKETEGKSGASGEVDPAQLAKGAGHILRVIAHKLTHSHSVMYPYMFEMLNEQKYTKAWVIMAQCLAQIGDFKREQQDPYYPLDFVKNADLPSPQVILSRCVLLAALPFRQQGLGMAALKLLHSVGPNLHESIGAFFDANLQVVIDHLEEIDEESFEEGKWQDVMLRLFKQTVEQVRSINPI
jgi:hypothetical protein